METMRCPDDDAISQHDVVDTQMYKQHQKYVILRLRVLIFSFLVIFMEKIWLMSVCSLRDMVYKLMTVNEYQPFASTGFEPG